ncbi:MAG: cyclic nucleotide-binding domain-containing protein, partial [Acidobacteriota bacterium]
MASLSADDAELIERLRSWKWFTHLDASVWSGLTSQLRKIRLEADEELFQQGDPGNAVYVVLEGQLGAYLAQDEGGEVLLGTMRAGNLVGEIQMMTGGVRTATVRATRDSELLRIPTEVSDELLRRSPETRRKMMAINRRRLRRTLLAEVLPTIVGPLNDEALRYLQAAGHWLELRRGETLFTRGDRGDSCYLLLRGRLAALLDDDGKEQIVSEIARGEFVGEMAVVTGEPRSMTVRAMRDSQMLGFTRQRFDRITSRYPQILKAVTRVLVGRLSKNTGSEVAPATGEVKTIAVVPAQRDAPWHELARRLAEALRTLGPTLRLTEERVRQRLDIRSSSAETEDDPVGIRLSAWLDDQELRFRFVLYIADDAQSAWTRRCVRQADLVLLVARADAATDLATTRSLLDADGRRGV